MGAIGYTVFEDDSGADWGADFMEKPSTEKVQGILSSAQSSEYVDDLQAAAALGCAEIVAAALNAPVRTMDDALLAWAQLNSRRLTPLKDTAIEAVRAVETNSELREIWDNNPGWIQYLRDLKQRLG